MKKKLLLLLPILAGMIVISPLVSYAKGITIYGYVSGEGETAVGHAEPYVTKSTGQLVLTNGSTPSTSFDNPDDFDIAIYAQDIDYLAQQVNALIDQRNAINARIEAERQAVADVFGD